jgi:hypothetical protein
MMMVACMLQIFSACKKPSASKVSLEEFQPHSASAAAAPMLAQRLPPCPKTSFPILQPSQSTGHHKVVLTWNASAPSPRAQDNAVGYCLYRSQTQNAAKKNPTCSICEQINSVPVVGTACVDDLVLDGAHYFYVAAAISSAGALSSSSNETAAPIPAKQSAVAPPANSYPLCRSAASSK